MFLDEVDSLSPHGQVALLRLLQNGSYRPLGCDREKTANLRVVAATNVSLEKLADQGRFRSDLLFRLDVARVSLPPLRERAEDVLPLAQYFLVRLARRYSCPKPELGAEARERLASYAWPGNVRELENAMERALLLSPPGAIDPAALPGASAQDEDSECLELASARAECIKRFERAFLIRLLDRSRGNITTAARLAGTERRHLGRMIKRNGIDCGQFRI
jgi:DNA-binding NtrC family response regulator